MTPAGFKMSTCVVTSKTRHLPAAPVSARVSCGSVDIAAIAGRATLAFKNARLCTGTLLWPISTSTPIGSSNISLILRPFINLFCCAAQYGGAILARSPGSPYPLNLSGAPEGRPALPRRRFRGWLVKYSGWCVPRCECKSAVCFSYLQGGRIASGTCTSGSTGTAADPGGAGRVVIVVGGRGELGDPDSGHGNKGKGEYHVSQA